jgi:hypothetical protein
LDTSTGRKGGWKGLKGITRARRSRLQCVAHKLAFESTAQAQLQDGAMHENKSMMPGHHWSEGTPSKQSPQNAVQAGTLLFTSTVYSCHIMARPDLYKEPCESSHRPSSAMEKFSRRNTSHIAIWRYDTVAVVDRWAPRATWRAA